MYSIDDDIEEYEKDDEQQSQEDSVETYIDNRKPYDTKIILGKKLNVFDLHSELKHHIVMRGMAKVDLIAQWDNIIGKIYADYSIPNKIRHISGVKTLFCKVKYTRIIEFQHQKTEFIKQINIFAGYTLVDDIKFVRVEKLPKRRRLPITEKIKSPKEKHPQLSKNKSQCQSTELQNMFNELAHLIMPVQSKSSVTTSQQNAQEGNPKIHLLNSWRDRARIILNCSQK